jgi:hypothetical protein
MRRRRGDETVNVLPGEPFAAERNESEACRRLLRRRIENKEARKETAWR